VVFNNSINKKEANVNWVAIAKTEMIKGILSWCVVNEIQSIMVEGGAATIQGFLTTNLWDECRVLEAGKSVGNGIKAPLLPEGKKASKKIVGDILQIIVNERP
jgi:diaminohydroxyphosphoribosylaminopyrimidine deaminase/5-amino-6-(5-phosphoribosylamino)uracil reductase